MPKMRVGSFIDGFNMYHAIHRLGRPHLKWTDYRGIISEFINPVHEELVDVFYFSAYATWLRGPYARHRVFVAALRAYGVTSILSKFKARDKECRKCHAKWKDHKEKQTDVRIAINMVQSVYENAYDKILLVSADSDLIPPIQMVQSVSPTIRLEVLVPPGRWKTSSSIRQKAKARRILAKHLEKHLLPDKIKVGGRIIRRPPEYNPPS